MKRLLPVAILMVIVLYLPSAAIDLDYSPLELKIQAVRHDATDLSEDDPVTPPTDDYFDFGFGDDESIYDYDYKSPKKAFIYSLLIPGWGQRYTESSTLKTLGFIGLEAVAWVAYFNYRNDGIKRTDEFEAFANEHWNEGPREGPYDGADTATYWGWLAGFNPMDSVYDESDFTHTLPEEPTQQYYEMIGKYDQFRGGWDDYWEDPLFYEESNEIGQKVNISPNREKYNGMRQDANDLLDRANTFVILSIANHLLSAFDAALGARSYNREKGEDMWLSMRAEMKRFSATEEHPILRVSLKF